MSADDADTALLSDGFHTFAELYEFRLLYHAHALRLWLQQGIRVVRSWRHDNGEECFGGGWFIVVAELPSGQVSNHYRTTCRSMFDGVPETPTAPLWDGHSVGDVLHRLRTNLEGSSDVPS
ncbi:hypothetical protein [Mycetocola zhujimingii]|uniref:WDGH domain-containing protein n=1 Tax=Mycetocola zhujimingii TaxID=2079792 RepID=UPI000D5A2138|nr:hypothetical protein [Mycetocola zhujimingii]